MYGGVAAKYTLYTLIGEPYKKNGKPGYYILAKAPFSKADPIEVKWYTDRAHAPVDKNAKSLYSIFGFKDKNDAIQIIRERDLSKDELENIFCFNWTKGYNWRGCAIFGGCWYAPADEPIPPIAKAAKVFRCSWNDFKTEMVKYARTIDAPADCVWFKEV